MTQEGTSSRKNLSQKFLIVSTIFFAIWIGFITFSADNFYPFSSISMFSVIFSSTCSSYVESNDTLFPMASEMDLLEVQQIANKYKNPTEACEVLKNQFTYLPSQFKIKGVCNTYMSEDNTIEKTTFASHECN